MNQNVIAFIVLVIGLAVIVRFAVVWMGKGKAPTGAHPWSVILTNDSLRTSDGQSGGATTALADISRIEVATDDSGPWGDDVVILLYGDGPDPVNVFPLGASGEEAFISWMTKGPGYRDEEFARAMSSTSVARFTVWTGSPES